MKEIDFKKIQIENFFSIGNDPLVIEFKKGLNIVTGINKDKEDSCNGLGKSAAICDSIFFALFGLPLRSLKKDDIVNWKTNSTARTILDFDIKENSKINSYKLIRTISPSGVVLMENNIDISRTIAETNKIIYNILGTTPEIFEQSIIMSVNQVEPFMAKKEISKRKFIEGIFKIGIFSEMLSLIRSDANRIERLFDIEKLKTSEINKTLENYIIQQKQQRQEKENRINVLLSRKKNNIQEIEQLTKKITQIDLNKKNEILEKIQILKNKQEELTHAIMKIVTDNATKQNQIENLTNKVNEINSIGEDVCVYCKQPFSENNKNDRKNLIKQHNDNITYLKNELTTLKQQQIDLEKLNIQCKEGIEKLTNQKHEFEIAIKENENTVNRIKQCDVWNKQIDVDIEKLQNDSDTYSKLIEETKTRLSLVEGILENYSKQIDMYNVAKFVVSEEGVKSFIVKKMIKLLNHKLNYYLHKLDANCSCEFDEYFNESITNYRNQKCSYFNFSSGERKRIDLAMLFTFMDIRRLQSNIYTNLSIYDELLDSSLDNKGIECALDILKEHVDNYNEAVYIISHKPEAIKHVTGEIVYLVKENEITRREDYVNHV